jgi:single-strand DNA-binding protein
MALNRVIIMGRMSKDAEIRVTGTGTKVTSFSLAVDRIGKDAGTDWLDIVAWKETAEFCGKHLGKGRNIVVEGRLQTRDWTDKDGNKRRNTEVVADRVYFADSKGETRNTAAPAQQYEAPAQQHELIQEEDATLPF